MKLTTMLMDNNKVRDWIERLKELDPDMRIVFNGAPLTTDRIRRRHDKIVLEPRSEWTHGRG